MDLDTIAWDVRDQADQAELHYNQPLRAKNKRLEDENLALKRLLRENGISWTPSRSAKRSSVSPVSTSSRVTRSSMHSRTLPHLPVEIQLRILSYALTSPHPIIDPLCKLKPDRLLVHEKASENNLAIHFLTTCRAYYIEGTKFLWSNNEFIFTSPDTLRAFADVDFVYRKNVTEATFRIVAKFFDDEDRPHKLPRTHHPDLKKPLRLHVHRRPKEKNFARRGFRAYAWYQLIDFLDAMLPPYDPSPVASSNLARPHPRPRLLPSLSKLRIDFVNFGEDLFYLPPPQLHDLASHQLGRSLNELWLTGLPNDDPGIRVSTELSGLLRDQGLLIDHAPVMLGNRTGLRALNCDPDSCHYASKLVRAFWDSDHHLLNDDHVLETGENLPPAPEDEGEPPYSPFFSCRTMWKRVPVRIDGEERKWELYDRISGHPWNDVEDQMTMFDYMDDDDDEPITCDNCGQSHPGAILPDDLMEGMYDD